MGVVNTFALFVLSTLTAIVGCYLSCLWLKNSATPWLAATQHHIPSPATLGKRR